jgi:hypothetical protein
MKGDNKKRSPAQCVILVKTRDRKCQQNLQMPGRLVRMVVL